MINLKNKNFTTNNINFDLYDFIIFKSNSNMKLETNYNSQLNKS